MNTLRITEAELTYYGMKFVNHHIRETEGITFEQYVDREMRAKQHYKTKYKN